MNTPVFKTICPADSQLRDFLLKVNFEDAYAFHAPLSAGNEESIEAVYIRIFNTAPKWVAWAMHLRNLLVLPFGLKTDVEKKQSDVVKAGEQAGLFKIYQVSEKEVIAGEDDKHLNFRVSVHRKKASPSVITVTTMVQYNNWFGKLYMTLIAPFHKMVVKSILKSMIKRSGKIKPQANIALLKPGAY